MSHSFLLYAMITIPVYSIMHIPHRVKCGCFHQAAEALVAAYLKEISNESCREASKTLVMINHSALKA